MRPMLCALLLIGLTAPAYPQALDVGRLMGASSMKIKTQDQADQEKQRNEDYQSTLKKLPDQNVKSDPWGNMRGGAGTGQAGPKSAAQKQKQAAPKQTQATGAQ